MLIASLLSLVLLQSTPPHLRVYPNDLTLVEETVSVPLPAGRSTFRVDFVRGNADVASLEVVPLDHPADVKVSALVRRDDLGNATFVEVDAKNAGAERFRLTYPARGLRASLSYLAVFDVQKDTLDFAQDLELDNGSGERFAGAAIDAVFGDVRTVPSNAVLMGRAPEPDAPAGLKAEPSRQDFAELTSVEFGKDVALQDAVLSRRRVLEKSGVATTIEYKVDASAWGNRVLRVIKAQNVESGLGGTTLEPGGLSFWLRDGDSERFLRGGGVGHVAPGGELELEAGFVDEITCERDVTDLARTDLVFGEYNKALVSWNETESIRWKVRNHAQSPRTLTVIEHVLGTDRFEVKDASVPANRKDQSTIEFKVEAPPGVETVLTFSVFKQNLRAG